VEKAGMHWATEQVRDLIDHDVRGIHFYTLNKAKATQHIYETLCMAGTP
jgi:methylenetetrahydrofolate reductase (NADPH)